MIKVFLQRGKNNFADAVKGVEVKNGDSVFSGLDRIDFAIVIANSMIIEMADMPFLDTLKISVDFVNFVFC
jgi:hypothetical protein